jgi:hypothetical protein
MSDLFEFINTMVGKPTEFNKIKMHERGKHFFMINRFCSIAFPVQASYFNHIKINPAQVVTFWQQLLSSKYSRTPGWMYVKSKKAKEEKKAKQPFTEQTIQTYCEKFQMSRRDFDTSVEILGDSFVNEVKEFEALITQ